MYIHEHRSIVNLKLKNIPYFTELEYLVIRRLIVYVIVQYEVSMFKIPGEEINLVVREVLGDANDPELLDRCFVVEFVNGCLELFSMVLEKNLQHLTDIFNTYYICDVHYVYHTAESYDIGIECTTN